MVYLIQHKLSIYVESNLHQQLFEYMLTHPSINMTTNDTKTYIKVIDDELLSQMDFVITFGGDGLLMHANTLFGGYPCPPIMCFDFGSFGFLAPFKYSDFVTEVDKILFGNASLILRMRLECTIYRNDTLTGKFLTSLILNSIFRLRNFIFRILKKILTKNSISNDISIQNHIY